MKTVWMLRWCSILWTAPYFDKRWHKLQDLVVVEPSFAISLLFSSIFRQNKVSLPLHLMTKTPDAKEDSTEKPPLSDRIADILVKMIMTGGIAGGGTALFSLIEICSLKPWIVSAAFWNLLQPS